MPIPIPQPDVFSISPILQAHQVGTQMRYQGEDRAAAREQEMRQTIARLAYQADTPEEWGSFIGAIRRRFPDADLSEYQDFANRDAAIGDGMTLEGAINYDWGTQDRATAAQDRATALAQRNALTQGLRTAADGQPVPTVDPNNPNWMLRGSGATGTNAPAVIDYANQGSIRNDPISGELSNAISAAAASVGIDRVVVHSGGQEAEGEGGARTGSTRHDHGNAADIDLYVGGRRLDYNNPADQAIFAQFVTAAANNGVTGIGAGEGYMGGNGRIHVGFGDPAVWGAGGAGENAPEWLRTAYNAASRERTGGAPFSDQQRAIFDALLDGGEIGPALEMLMAATQPPEPPETVTLADGTELRTVGGTLLARNEPDPPAGGDGGLQQTRNILQLDGKVHIMGFNPQTGNYDRDQGLAPADAPLVAFNGDPIQGPLLTQAIEDMGTAQTVGAQVQNLEMFRELTMTTPTGWWENASMGVRGALVSMGVISDPNLAEQQVFQAFTNQFALWFRNPDSGFGLPGAASNFDLQFLRGIVPNLQNRPEANQFVATMLLAKQRREAELAQLRADYIFENATLQGYNQYRTAWIDEHSIFTPDERAFIEGLSGIGGGGTTNVPLPPGVTQEQWNVMTPTERALFR